MRPISRIRSRSMSKALRKWLQHQLKSLGLIARQKEHHWPLSIRWMRDGIGYKSVLSAARAAGIRMVPAI